MPSVPSWQALVAIPHGGSMKVSRGGSGVRAAADDLVDWKRTKGISTNVFEVGAGTARTTGAQIDTFIEDRYRNCSVRPSYVLLIGDSEFVPPARTNHDTLPSCVRTDL